MRSTPVGDGASWVEALTDRGWSASTFDLSEVKEARISLYNQEAVRVVIVIPDLPSPKRQKSPARRPRAHPHGVPWLPQGRKAQFEEEEEQLRGLLSRGRECSAKGLAFFFVAGAQGFLWELEEVSESFLMGLEGVAG